MDKWVNVGMHDCQNSLHVLADVSAADGECQKHPVFCTEQLNNDHRLTESLKVKVNQTQNL